MNYFVSIEDVPYHRWQIDLLYESLKDHGVEDRLVIAACPYKVPESNLPGTVYRHKNIGRDVGYTPLNKPYSLYHAIKDGALELPVTVIDPDMIMARPVAESSVDVTGQFVWYMNYDNLEFKFRYKMQEYFGITKDEWIPIGCVYQFSKSVDVEFFKQFFDWCEKLLEMFPGGDGQLDEYGYWFREMMAFAIPLSKTVDYDVKLVKNYEMPLDSAKIFQEYNDNNSSFIHYCNGIPGRFHKKTHNSLKEFSVTPPLPYETILSIPSGKNNRLRLMKRYCKRLKEQNYKV